jgi:glutathionylspermidine synthase
MIREMVRPRPDWRDRLEAIGLTYHSLDGPYWTDDVCYHFDENEIENLEVATKELQALCHHAIERIIQEDRFDQLHIGKDWGSAITRSWEHQAPSLYGRFDLCYDGIQPPKLLEYNADTPTSLIEASVAQWYWLKDLKPECDQFNSLHEHLIARWTAIRRELDTDLVHFTCVNESEEDSHTLLYLMDTAQQAGLRTLGIPIGELGWNTQASFFVDQMNEPIEALFKLYPWEWMTTEEFAPYLLASSLTVLEPAWKMLLSHKGLLALLWEWFADHPNLLPAFLSPEPLGGSYVQKPFWSREGANVAIVRSGDTVRTAGPYGEEGFVYQAYASLPEFNGWHSVIGSWVVGDSAAGIGIREDRSLIMNNCSRFVPHYFVPKLH